MVVLPSIPTVVHLQDGGIALSRQVISCHALTMILEKKPIPESSHPLGRGGVLSDCPMRGCLLDGRTSVAHRRSGSPLEAQRSARGSGDAVKERQEGCAGFP